MLHLQAHDKVSNAEALEVSTFPLAGLPPESLHSPAIQPAVSLYAYLTGRQSTPVIIQSFILADWYRPDVWTILQVPEKKQSLRDGD